MKCEIIRDLIPSYVDGLTSDESNSEIRAHLEICDGCREVYGQMKSDLAHHEPISSEKDEIKPFKKINRRIKQYIAVTLAACLAAAGIFLYLFAIGWSVKSNEMIIEYSYEEGVVYLEFDLQNDHSLLVRTSRDESGSDVHTISLRQSFIPPFDDRGEFPNKFSYGIGYVDAEEGNAMPPDDAIIEIKYGDKTETIYVKDLVER